MPLVTLYLSAVLHDRSLIYYAFYFLSLYSLYGRILFLCIIHSVRNLNGSPDLPSTFATLDSVRLNDNVGKFMVPEIPDSFFVNIAKNGIQRVRFNRFELINKSFFLLINIYIKNAH